MENNEKETLGPAEHIAIGAGLGAAGVAQSIAAVGVVAAIPLLPVFVVAGAAGGLVWWRWSNAIKKL